MITYLDEFDTITPAMLEGFFEGWPNPPSPETHLRILKESYAALLAYDTETGRGVGFINAVSDGVLSAYLPLLEVIPAYRGRGIGRELMRRMLDRLHEFYMVDLVCNPDKIGFYEKSGMKTGHAMVIRRFDRQAGINV